MFEYDVHNMQRAVEWYQNILGLEIVFKGDNCHTEFALPVKGARLALSLTGKDIPIQKAARLFIPTHDIYAVEADLKKKDVNMKPIENIHNVVLILWVEDSEGNHFAFEQWINRT
jgi:catechol 2,3-dioxygenase-like lactoylglutathione lyase family enzyme